MLIDYVTGIIVGVAPHGERGLKYKDDTAYFNGSISVAPHGERGLK